MKKYLIIIVMAILVASCNKPAGELVGLHGGNQSFFEAICPALPAHGYCAPKKTGSVCTFEQLAARAAI